MQSYQSRADKASPESAPAGRVLIVEDEPDVAHLLDRVIRSCGDYAIQRCTDPQQFAACLQTFRPDRVFTDLAMPGIDGFEIIRRVRAYDENLPVVVVSAHASLENAIQAIKIGAFDFLAKPFSTETVEIVLEKITRELALRARALEACRLAASRDPGLAALMGASAAMSEVREWIARVRPTRANVLIEGETGTGKELVARALRQGDSPFVAINLAALPGDLIESELFGHRRGAFSGAHTDHKGLIESAHGGILFLDEVNSAPPQLQAKLLRVLEDKRVRPVGGSAEIAVDVRFIAATNQPLEPLVAAGQFRRDLYHRLKVLGVTLPPLRARREDIPLYVREFVPRYARAHGRRVREASETLMRELVARDWPGNVRELENWIEQAVILSADDALELDLPAGAPRPLTDAGAANTLAAAERRHILHILAECGGNKSRAARVLGIDYKTLLRKLPA
ncbi:MAG: sigma-54 dependent transcriptional regulator [Thiobacillus sp.]|nr:sigma-54 dependent transcriptional regulator [Thiobacillus sp.]